jgi:hypothetical protein
MEPMINDRNNLIDVGEDALQVSHVGPLFPVGPFIR